MQTDNGQEYAVNKNYLLVSDIEKTKYGKQLGENTSVHVGQSITELLRTVILCLNRHTITHSLNLNHYLSIFSDTCNKLNFFKEEWAMTPPALRWNSLHHSTCGFLISPYEAVRVFSERLIWDFPPTCKLRTPTLILFAVNAI